MIGLIGTKMGMTQVFDERGVLTPVTVIRIEQNFVVAERSPERDGYSACVLGAVAQKPSRVTKPYAGQFKDDLKPQKYLHEVKDFDVDVQVGSKIGVEAFADLPFVDVIGTSKGKGYQGVMKRHGFSGGSKTHGSKFHREAGSVGMATTPGWVRKGKKMPGRMGADRTTAQNLRVVSVDQENQLLLVEGSVPGRRNGIVYVRNAGKKS